MGNVYADDWTRATRGAGWRLGIMAGTVVGAAIAARGGEGFDSIGRAGAAMVAGGAVLAVRSGYDIFVTSAHSVRDHNARFRDRADVSLSMFVPPGGGGAGVQLRMSF